MGMSRSDSSFLHPPQSMSGSPRPCPKGPGPPQRAHSFCERMPGGVQTIVGLQDALPLAESPLLKTPDTPDTPDTPERSIYPIITKAASAAAVQSQPMVRQYPSPTPCKPLPLPTLTSVRPVLRRRRSSETGEQEREAEKVVAVANVRQANDRRVLLELDITDSNNTRSIHVSIQAFVGISIESTC